MKDLIDDLNKLGKEEFKVSPDFRKNIMKTVHREKTFKKVTVIASSLCAACVVVLCLIVVNRNGVFNNAAEFTSGNILTSTSSKTADSLYSADNANIEEAVYEENTRETAVNSFNADVSFDSAMPSNVKATSKVQISKSEYLDELLILIKDNGLEAVINEDVIEIKSNNYKKVSEILEKYKDTEISISGDIILVEISE